MQVPAALQPLRRRLPLLISALLLAVVAAFSWAAYDRFERALLVAGKDRVGNASQRLAGALAESGRRGRADWRRLAGDTTIHRYLRTRDPNATAAANGLLRRWVDSIPQAMAVELRDAAGNSRLAAGRLPRASALSPRSELSATRAPDSTPRVTSLGPFVTMGDTVFYEMSSPIMGAGGNGAGGNGAGDDGARADTLGHLVLYRRIASTGAGVQLIGGLIGSDATVLLGNRRGDVWTDLDGSATAPTTAIVPGVPLTIGGHRGEASLGMATLIEGTPWVVLVAMPRRHVLAPARDLLGATVWLAALVLAAGALCAWLLSRQITDPLAEMTRAAEGIAGGDYSQHVTAAREDELGRLAAAFNSMAHQVRESTRTLEHRVVDRTLELEQALGELRAAQDELVRRERLAGEARYRRLVETAHEGVWTVDGEQKTDYVNPRMAAMLGYAPDEMIGRPMFDFIAEDAREVAAGHVERRRQGIAEVFEVALQRRDGSKVLTFISASPILDESGQYAGTLSMVMDMTEHRRLETQLRQTQKMEAVGQLAGGVAHDFNNLLTVIKGFSAFLLEDLAEGNPHRDDVREIDQAAGRAAALTRQLLAFSRQQVLEPRVLDLNELVKELEKMLRRLIPADVAIATKLAADLGLVEADPGQMEQVLMNLAVNARDAMPDGGTIAIETENAELGDTYDAGHSPPVVVPGPYVVLVVSDTGCGMDKGTQARIFDPFFTTKEKGKGTGLGLSTVYGIVKQSGGYIWVYSEPGKGTTFRVYLPRVMAECEEGERNAAEDPAGPGAETILLVEDDEAVRAMARRILGRNGYAVLEATTGAEALRICAESSAPIDLILSDLVMPEMGGRELAAQVRAFRPVARLLFMSGYTEEAAMKRSVLDPSEAFLSKPFTPDALTRKVREVLDRPAGVRPPGEAYQPSPDRVRRG